MRIYNSIRSFLFALANILFLSACQTVTPMSSTSSGRPEAVFPGLATAEVSSRLANQCMQSGLLIIDQSEYQIICGKTMQGGEAVLAQMLVGNSYSTTPEQKIRFSLFNHGGVTKVQAYQWFESQMAFGQVNRQELNSGQQFNDVQSMLHAIGGSSTRNASRLDSMSGMEYQKVSCRTNNGEIQTVLRRICSKIGEEVR